MSVRRSGRMFLLIALLITISFFMPSIPAQSQTVRYGFAYAVPGETAVDVVIIDPEHANTLIHRTAPYPEYFDKKTFVGAKASPDGYWIFLKYFYYERGSKYQLLNMETGQTKLIATVGDGGGATLPEWSPDSQYLSFDGNFFTYVTPDPAGAGKLDPSARIDTRLDRQANENIPGIHIYSVATGAFQNIRPENRLQNPWTFPYAASWSSDSQQIIVEVWDAYHKSENSISDNQYHLEVFSRPEWKLLKQIPVRDMFCDVEVSPNTRYIVVAANCNPDFTLHSFDLYIYDTTKTSEDQAFVRQITSFTYPPSYSLDYYPHENNVNYSTKWLDDQSVLIGVRKYEYFMGDKVDLPGKNLVNATFTYNPQTGKFLQILPYAASDIVLGQKEIAYRATIYKSVPVDHVQATYDRTQIIARYPLSGKPLQELEPGCNYRWSPSETVLGYEVLKSYFWGCQANHTLQPLIRLVFANRQTNQVVTYPIPDAEQTNAKVAGWVILPP